MRNEAITLGLIISLAGIAFCVFGIVGAFRDMDNELWSDDSGESATVYTRCPECDIWEGEFHGWVDNEDVAHFDCPFCGQEFVFGTYDGWSNFFNEEDDE